MTSKTELYKQHLEAQNKYTYFLLAVAASAIALSLKRTTDSKITLSMIPLVFALLSWGLSFFCGCRRSTYVQINLYSNISMLQAQDGKHPLAGDDPKKIEVAVRELKRAMEDNSNKLMLYSTWQFRLLVFGALFFISWHIIEMIITTMSSG